MTCRRPGSCDKRAEVFHIVVRRPYRMCKEHSKPGLLAIGMTFLDLVSAAVVKDGTLLDTVKPSDQ